LSVYCDTSLYVSSYVQDRHSEQADKLLASADQIFLTPLHLSEWTHAISQHVFLGVMQRSEAERLSLEFEADRAAGFWLEVAMPENAFSLCRELALRHGQELGMRTLDSLHVACALELKADRFWTFDVRQAKLAKAQGLKAI
jgi:predicted nucleic acid-binding protein